jgi:hypothetical protein
VPVTPDPLAPLADLPGVADAIEHARTACEQLRWHEAFRRRAREVRAEASLHVARHSAAIDGARIPMPALRAVAGGGSEQHDDPDTAVARGALRAQAMVERLVPELGSRHTPTLPPLRELLARLHTAAGAGWLAPEHLGHPRTAGTPNQDLRGLGTAPTADEVAARLDLLAEVTAATSVPALVSAAVVHGELLALRPFVAANGVVARAAARVLVTRGGLDPTGTVVPEAAWSPNPHVYAAAAAGFVTGTPDGVARWIAAYADALVQGAAHARTLADAVLAGTLPQD